MRVTIIGGGIIGLACAWRLASEQHHVVVCDANSESREASWAAAGMLAPHSEAKEVDDLWRLCYASLQQWPEFLSALSVSHQDVDFRQVGSLEPLLPGDDRSALESKVNALSAAGAQMRWLDQTELKEQESELSTQVQSALWMEAAQVDPRRMCQILRQRCEALGVELRYQQRVQAIEDQDVLLAEGQRIRSDQILLAAGAWTPELSRLSGHELKGEPVKGQMLAFDAGPQLLRHFIHCRHAYMVPRSGTGVVIGSTMEYSGFDRSENQAAIASLAANAQHVLPALREAAIKETWTGLRPRLKGGLPVFTRLNPYLCLATGHFRNGILLTPMTADIMAAIICNEQPCHEIAAFSGAEALV